MLVYLDSSALLKRVLREDHAAALRTRLSELADGPHELLTSTLGWVEITRALKTRAERAGERPGDQNAKALAGVSGYPVSYEVISLARKIGPQELRSLDAIHCATASLTDCDLLISYDRRMLDAAALIGFATESPGVGA